MSEQVLTVEERRAADIWTYVLAKVQDYAEKENADIADAIRLAALEGPAGRDKLVDRSGNPIPESMVFGLVLLFKDWFFKWIMSLIQDALSGGK